MRGMIAKIAKIALDSLRHPSGELPPRWARLRAPTKEDIHMKKDPLWYKDAIIYELPVKAFLDSSGDGIGDFKGLMSKLDYLEYLGITAVLEMTAPSLVFTTAFIRAMGPSRISSCSCVRPTNGESVSSPNW